MMVFKFVIRGSLISRLFHTDREKREIKEPQN